MLRKTTLLLAFSVMAMVVYGQDEIFKVLASKGDVKLKATQKRLWGGSSLKKTDEIVVGSDSYIGLMHTSGRTVEIKQPGTYKVSDLAGKAASAGSSTTAKYVSYVASEITKADKRDINQNHRKYMAMTGAVERANPCLNLAYFVHEPNVKPQEVDIFGDKIILHLYKSPIVTNDLRNKTYVVRILDMRRKEILANQVKANDKAEAIVELDFSKIAQHGSAFILELSVKELAVQAREHYAINIVREGEKYDRVKKAIAELQDGTALSKIVEAGIFEQEGFYLDALTSYEKAIAMEPDVDAFKVAYEDFLIRNRMKLFADKGEDGKPILRPYTINPDVKEEDVMKPEAKAELENAQNDNKKDVKKKTK
ncbi:MAG: hypothetical protein RMJ97_07960 [Raineya sp.]|nr:hypothetical protein [Raineya sp.]MDW8296806.1 hypothetical protein [Raineya sp.]